MHSFLSSWSILLSLSAYHVHGYNFPYEATQLTDADVVGNPDVQFGNPLAPASSNSTCKVFPGDTAWPSIERWDAFNTSLGGALVRALPAGAPCYSGPNYNPSKCVIAKYSLHSYGYIFNDPAAVMQTWAEGNNCPTTAPANTTCEQGGWPVYVVNATTVKHIQQAVNFARNNNIRLVIKNTGHDFLGRSTGAGALGIWTHQLKALEYLPGGLSSGTYKGPVTRLGIGLQAYDIYAAMDQYNITINGPITNTVGYGGFVQGGGHSHFTSYYGLGADQVLSTQIVTADGRFITADDTQNSDLFWAIRGGGAGNWGVVTSTIVRTHSVTPFSQNTVFFGTGSGYNNSIEAFWEGVRLYHRFVPKIVDARGQGSNYLSKSGNGTFTFQNTIWMPKMGPDTLDNFTAPHLAELRAVGISLDYTPGAQVQDYAKNLKTPPPGLGGFANNALLSSRLWPRHNFQDETLLKASINAIRKTVEAGYSFHSNNYAPNNAVQGRPDNAVNTAFKYTVGHASMFDKEPGTGSPEEIKANYDKFQQVFQGWRDVTPTAGCYMNEASVMEPNFQWAFYGQNYPRLQQIKKNRDPWGLFYVTTGVGSEYWEVRTPVAGLNSQDGKLCRLTFPSSTWSDPSHGTVTRRNKRSNVPCGQCGDGPPRM